MAQFLDLTGLTRYKNKSDALYAKQDGSYEGMTVGNAEQLVSTVGVSDNAPYTFRTTGGSADVGDRLNLKAVVGGTVAWNQLETIPSSDKSKTQNGVTIVDNRDGSFTVSTDANGATADTYLVTATCSVIKDHKYFFKSAPIGGNISTFYAYTVQNGVIENKTDLGGGCIQKCLANGTVSVVGIFVKSGAVITTAIKFIPQFFDLTAMFGSTIADYAYTLESGTAGAGVAWLKKYGYFTKPYYPYKAAALESVKTSAHKTIGFNQFDEVCESGYINTSTGDNDDSVLDTRYRSKNYIRVVPDTTYYYKASVSQTNNSVKARIYFYDASKSFISSVLTSAVSDTFTTPSNCGFIRFFVNQALSTYNHDICINLHWDGERDGEYEPYEEHTYALDDVELRGILKLDANNNLYYDGDEYTPDGTVSRKMQDDTITVGSMYTPSSNANYDWAIVTLSNSWTKLNTQLIGEKVLANNALYSFTSANIPIGTIISYSSGNKQIAITVAKGTTKAQAEATYNGTHILYELATPTTESADPYTELQICSDWGVEEFVDATYSAGNRDLEMPCGHESVFSPNLRAKLEMSPNSPESSGDYLVRQTDGTNEYVSVSSNSVISGLSTRCPSCPTDTDGNFVLKAVVSSGSVTYSWVSA